MALERETVIGLRAIDEYGVVMVRYDQYIVDTDTGERVAGPIYHRTSFMPGSDVSKEAASIQALTAVAWTKDILDKIPERLPPVSPVTVQMRSAPLVKGKKRRG